MAMRVLTWNLMHGRAVPGAGRELQAEFGDALAGWTWDAALLQEVPPWWPPGLAARCEAGAWWVLTSRNGGLAVRRAVATRWPDLLKSNGGGANAILIRGGEGLVHRRQRLCRWPERRWVHAVLVREGAFGNGTWVANLHASAHHTGRAVRDDELAARSVLRWSGGQRCLLGGDFNLRALTLPGFERAGGHDVDHVFVRGLDPGAGTVEVLERGTLSDHAPVRVTVG